MLRQISAWLPEELAKPLVVALILITPGSFLILPLLAWYRIYARRDGMNLTQALRNYFVKALR